MKKGFQPATMEDISDLMKILDKGITIRDQMYVEVLENEKAGKERDDFIFEYMKQLERRIEELENAK